MKKYFLYLLLIAFVPMASAQSASYVILSCKGNVQVADKSAPQGWREAKSKDKLSSTSKIKIANGARILFYDKSYHLYECNKTGEYSLDKLKSNAVINTDAAMSRSVKFMAEEMFSAHHEEKGQKAKGVVSRGENFKFPPDNTVVISSEIIFLWGASSSGPYGFSISDSNSTYFNQKTYSKSFHIALDSIQLPQGQKFQWGTGDSHPANIYIPTLQERENIRKEIESFKSMLIYSETTNALLLAGFYESKNLFIEADSTYERAVKQYPEDTMLKEAYKIFLRRMGLPS